MSAILREPDTMANDQTATEEDSTRRAMEAWNTRAGVSVATIAKNKGSE